MPDALYGNFRYGEEYYGGVYLVDSVVPSYLALRVNFAEPVYDDEELNDPDNYTITRIGSPAVTASVVGVSPEPGGSPNYVDLECTDLTHGKQYQIEIASGKLQDAGQTKYFTFGLDATYFGVSTTPEIQSLLSTTEYEMRVVFTKAMAVNADLLDPTNWVFDKGLTVRAVSSPSPGVVLLTTSKQVPSELYTLTVS